MKRRRPSVAGLLSFLAPGIGQLYNGDVRRAALFFCAFAVLNLAFFFGLPNLEPGLPALGVLLLLAAGSFGLQVAAAIQACREAYRAPAARTGPWQHGWIYIVAVLALPVIGALAAPPWIKSFYSPSSSNVPTLLVGERFFVAVRYYRNHEPQRGDIVVFKSPKDGSIDYVKRIVGLPGEKVQLRAGNLYIDGRLVPRQQIDDYIYKDHGQTLAMHQYIETLPGNTGTPAVSHRIIKIGDNGPLDNTPIYEVPVGNYFTLGDNRDNSLDSRVLSALGYVPARNLIGRAYIVYWPLNRLRTID